MNRTAGIRARLVQLLLVLALTGCAVVPEQLPEPESFDPRDYVDKRVGVLPVVVNPGQSISPESKAAFQRILANRLAVLNIKNPEVVTSTQMEDVPASEKLKFPYTTQDLKRISVALGLDAAIVMNLVSIQQNPQLGLSTRNANESARTLRLSALFMFADAQSDAKSWVSARVWNAESLDSMYELLRDEMFADFWDFRFFLFKVGKKDWPLSTGTESSELGPLILVATDPNATRNMEVDDRLLDMDVSVFDRDGISRVTVSNEVIGYNHSVFEPLESDADATCCPDPYYVSQRLFIPLLFGTNHIQFATVDSTGREARKSIEIERPRAPARKRIIGMEVPVNGVPSQKYFETLFGRNAEVTWLTGDQATKQNFRLVTLMQSLMTSGRDELVFYFGGRLAVLDDGFSLVASDTNTEFLSISGITDRDLNRFFGDNSLIIIDACLEVTHEEKSPGNDVDAEKARDIVEHYLSGSADTIINIGDCESEREFANMLKSGRKIVARNVPLNQVGSYVTSASNPQ